MIKLPPLGSLNHISIPLGNLEASVRSRDNEIAAGTQRDLIEAGLSEPAGGGRGYGDYVCGARSKARHWRRRVTILGD